MRNSDLTGSSAFVAGVGTLFRLPILVEEVTTENDDANVSWQQINSIPLASIYFLYRICLFKFSVSNKYLVKNAFLEPLYKTFAIWSADWICHNSGYKVTRENPEYQANVHNVSALVSKTHVIFENSHEHFRKTIRYFCCYPGTVLVKKNYYWCNMMHSAWIMHPVEIAFGSLISHSIASPNILTSTQRWMIYIIIL